MPDQIDDVVLDVRFARAGDADRLVERDVDGRLFLAPTSSPSMRTSSPSPTFVPEHAGTPLQVTRPASIHLSASRREQTPVSLMYLLSLIAFLCNMASLCRLLDARVLHRRNTRSSGSKADRSVAKARTTAQQKRHGEIKAGQCPAFSLGIT
jgi:hypothetical protein